MSDDEPQSGASAPKPGAGRVAGFRLRARLVNNLLCLITSRGDDPSLVEVYFYPTTDLTAEELSAAEEFAGDTIKRFSNECAPANNLTVLQNEEVAALQAPKDGEEPIAEEEKPMPPALIFRLPENARITQDSGDPALDHLKPVIQKFFSTQLLYDVECSEILDIPEEAALMDEHGNFHVDIKILEELANRNIPQKRGPT